MKTFGKIQNVMKIYMDGLKDEGSKNEGGMIIIRRGPEQWEEIMFTVSEQCLVFIIEITAINKAIDIALKRFQDRDVLILSDLLSRIRSVNKEYQ